MRACVTSETAQSQINKGPRAGPSNFVSTCLRLSSSASEIRPDWCRVKGASQVRGRWLLSIVSSISDVVQMIARPGPMHGERATASIVMQFDKRRVGDSQMLSGVVLVNERIPLSRHPAKP